MTLFALRRDSKSKNKKTNIFSLFFVHHFVFLQHFIVNIVFVTLSFFRTQLFRRENESKTRKYDERKVQEVEKKSTISFKSRRILLRRCTIIRSNNFEFVSINNVRIMKSTYDSNNIAHFTQTSSSEIFKKSKRSMMKTYMRVFFKELNAFLSFFNHLKNLKLNRVI